MEEKRLWNRYSSEGAETVVISNDNLKVEAKILDIGAGGMKISCQHPLGCGTMIYGQFKILPTLGAFFVKGTAERVTEVNGTWEIVVKFDKVSTIPLNM